MWSARSENRSGASVPWKIGAGLVVALSATALMACGGQATGSVPPQFVGSWALGGVSSTNYFDPNGGGYSAPSGTERAYKFEANGHYIEAELSQVSLYGCSTGYFGYNEGAAIVTGSQLSLRSSGGTLRQWASCSGKDDKQQLDGSQLNQDLVWQLIPDASSPVGNDLQFSLPDGSVSITLSYQGPP